MKFTIEHVSQETFTIFFYFIDNWTQGLIRIENVWVVAEEFAGQSGTSSEISLDENLVDILDGRVPFRSDVKGSFHNVLESGRRRLEVFKHKHKTKNDDQRIPVMTSNV